MPRRTTAKSLEHLSSGRPDVDKIARELLLRLADGELVVTKQDPLEDDEFITTDYYGEYKGIGVTCRSIKKLRGINPRYVMCIETEEEEINLSGPFGARAWNLAIVQQKGTSTKKISSEAVSNVLTALGLD